MKSIIVDRSQRKYIILKLLYSYYVGYNNYMNHYTIISVPHTYKGRDTSATVLMGAS